MMVFETLMFLGVVTALLNSIKSFPQLGVITLIVTTTVAMIGHTIKAVELWLKYRNDNDDKEVEK